MEVVDFLRDPKRFERLGATRAEGPPALRAARHRQDAAREGGRARVGRELLLRERVVVRRDVRRASAPRASASSSPRRARTRPRSSSSTSSTPSAPQRTGHGFNREQDQTLNQLLVELDGFEGAQQVVVMGASNRIQDLDPALLRPGRFDRQMLVPPPDLAGREAILGVHTRGKPLAADVDLAPVARQTSRADRRRAREHLQRGRDLRRPPRRRSASRRRTSTPRSSASSPACSRRRSLTEKERRILAYHEGGHALMAHLMGAAMELQKVTIVARGDALGYALLPARGGSLPPHEGGAASTG